MTGAASRVAPRCFEQKTEEEFTLRARRGTASHGMAPAAGGGAARTARGA